MRRGRPPRRRCGLAVLLQFAEAEADNRAVRGTIRDAGPPPPSVDDLAKLAVCNRPDVVAYRRGVKRAMADVQLARRERFEDVFLFYTPYAFQNYAYQGLQSATSWSVGGLVSIPLFNRNQGNIARAKEGVVQAQIELSGVERQAAFEVRRAALDFATTDRAVRRFEGDILTAPGVSGTRPIASSPRANGRSRTTSMPIAPITTPCGSITTA